MFSPIKYTTTKQQAMQITATNGMYMTLLPIIMARRYVIAKKNKQNKKMLGFDIAPASQKFSGT